MLQARSAYLHLQACLWACTPPPHFCPLQGLTRCWGPVLALVGCCRFLWQHIHMLGLGMALLVVLKSSLVALVVRAYGTPWRTAWGVGISLGHVGEFAFILLSMATQLKIVTPQVGGQRRGGCRAVRRSRKWEEVKGGGFLLQKGLCRQNSACHLGSRPHCEDVSAGERGEGRRKQWCCKHGVAQAAGP